jgi:hypothetical protein
MDTQVTAFISSLHKAIDEREAQLDMIKEGRRVASTSESQLQKVRHLAEQVVEATLQRPTSMLEERIEQISHLQKRFLEIETSIEDKYGDLDESVRELIRKF